MLATGLPFAQLGAQNKSGALAQQADDLSTEIVSCVTSKTPVADCAASSVVRLRRLRAQIAAFARANPEPDAPWTRDLARLNSAVDRVAQNAQKRSLLEAASQLQILADSLPAGAGGPASASGKTSGSAPSGVTEPANPARSAGSSAPLQPPQPMPAVPAPATLPSEPIRKEGAGFSLVTAGKIEANDWTSSPPEMRLHFLIERADHTPFTGVNTERMAATLEVPSAGAGDGPQTREVPIALKPSDLVTKSAADSSVILVIDASGSMTAGTRGESGERVDKLSAAKSAIGDFLSALRPEDKVAIMAFDAEPRVIFSLNSNKNAARAAIDNFHITPPGSLYTALYDAMDLAVARAKQLGIKNVVFLTDGVEDSPQFGVLKDREKGPWKQQREHKIAAQARASEVRIYSIGIGNRAAPEKDMSFVDCDTLDRISQATHGGVCNYVDLPDLARRANHSASEYHAALVSRLSGILLDINKAFHYDYTLVLHPAKESLIADGRQHMVRVVCNLDRVQLPVEFPYVWNGSATPEFRDPRVGPPRLIELRSQVPVSSLVAIYVRCLLFLLLLALIPQLFRWYAARKEVAAARSAVLTIGKGSHLIGRECPNERNKLGREFLIKEGDPIIVCPACNAPHHLSCWHENRDRCRVRACSARLELIPAVLKVYGLEEKQGASV